MGMSETSNEQTQEDNESEAGRLLLGILVAGRLGNK
jgi:hypothetical protein